jgi:2-polyprenyl-3-methyl-5-hydroxy-6-metoxy-1,4-benzoquinol methylase
MTSALFSTAIRAARDLGIDTRAAYQLVSRWSLEDAAREQGLSDLVVQLRKIVPDLRRHFSGVLDEREYIRFWEAKMRTVHAWQVQCVLRALDSIAGDQLTVVDIGDSAGTHAAYLRALAPQRKLKRIIGINLDAAAVQRIQASGGEAIQSRAEDLRAHDIESDLFLSFETLEHLTDPLRFLHRLAEHGQADHMLITVPYRRASRFGGMHLRMRESDMPAMMNAEEVHIYEFSPDDWALLARFAGFRPVFTSTYRQYARWSWSRLTAGLWRKLDFEGFVAIFLERDLSLSRRYRDW